MRSIRRTLSVLTLSAAATAAGIFGYQFADNHHFAMAKEQVEATREQLNKAEDLSTVFRSVGKVVEPSVVNITVTKTLRNTHRRLPFSPDQLRKFFPKDENGDPQLPDGFGDDGSGDDAAEQIGTGSGVIMDVDGKAAYILTNNHVAGGAEKMVVTLSDGREIKNAKLVGADPKADLAVVKIEADHLIGAKWGDSGLLQKGDWIMAFGSPFGYVGSMTHGIVSALDRTNVGILGQNGYEDFIQVDAPINPGNSGGPLVNLHGEVVGVNTAIASRSGGFQGIGFAIPSNQAKLIYTALREHGKVTRGWLGVSIQDVGKNLELAKSFGYTGDTGVLVQQTFPGTPANGKLEEGDIVSKMNGKPVDNVMQLRNSVAAMGPNQNLTMTVFRQGKNIDVTLKTAEQPEDMVAASGVGGATPPAAPSPNNEATLGKVGLKVATMNDELAQKYGLGTEAKGGALIIQVTPRSIAAQAGLRPGDLITRIGRKAVTDAKGVADALAKADLDKGVQMYVASREGSRFVLLKNESAQ